MFISVCMYDAYSDFNNSVTDDYKDRRQVSVKNHSGV